MTLSGCTGADVYSASSDRSSLLILSLSSMETRREGCDETGKRSRLCIVTEKLETEDSTHDVTHGFVSDRMSESF